MGAARGFMLGHTAAVADSIPGAGRALRWAVDPPELELGFEPKPSNPAIERIVAEPGALWVWLNSGYEWAQCADAVRAELDRILRALASSEGAGADSGAGADARLEDSESMAEELASTRKANMLKLVATDLIDGDLASYIASHGGQVRVHSVRFDGDGGELGIEFAGACKGCELSEITLHVRIENALARRVPQLSRVFDATQRRKSKLFEGLFRRPGMR